MDLAVESLRIINEAIADDDTINLNRYLQPIDLADLDDETSDELLNGFILVCYEYQRHKCAEIIIDYWTGEQEEEEHYTILPPIARFFISFTLDDDVLRFILEIEKFTATEILEALVSFADDDSISVGITRLLTIHKIKVATANRYYEEAIRDHKIAACEALAAYLEENEEHVPLPPWIIGTVPLTKETIMTHLVEPTPMIGLPEREQVIAMLVQGANTGLELEDITETMEEFTRKWDSLTEEEKIKIFEPVVKDLQLINLDKDVEMARCLGPANNIYGLHLGEDHICSRYGGCRMLTCQHFTTFENDFLTTEDQDETPQEWFTGNCDNCHRKLEFKCQAVRTPVVNGGWKGCFCSFRCMRIFKDLISEGVENMLQDQLIEKKEKEITEMGIYLQEN